MARVSDKEFDVSLVKNGALLESAQRLRKKIFFHEDGIDQDEFDGLCDHIVALDRERSVVVGTYRLLRGSSVRSTGEFYSATEFDLTNITKNCKGEILEMGRACVDPAYRKYSVINLIWKQIIRYVAKYDVKYIFGCASIDKPSPQKIGSIYEFFKKKHLSTDEFRVHPLEGKSYPYAEGSTQTSEHEVIKMLPSLIKGYLKMGAAVCGEPVWDRIFDTADFFMLLDTRKINISYRERFS